MATQEKYNEPFPSRLRKLLDDRGITITALSKELKISRQAVSQYTDGSAQPNIEKLRAIASFFDVSAVSDYIGAVDRAKKWSKTVSSIYEERKNVRVKRFLLTESLFDVLEDYIKLPDFSALELKARMLEKRQREAKEDAICKEENK